MANRGKKKVVCAHPACTKHGFLSAIESSCLDGVGMKWMCPKHDDLRTFKCNSQRVEV